MEPLTEQETAYILSILARHWQDEDIRNCMRLLAGKRVKQKLNDPTHIPPLSE